MAGGRWKLILWSADGAAEGRALAKALGALDVAVKTSSGATDAAGPELARLLERSIEGGCDGAIVIPGPLPAQAAWLASTVQACVRHGLDALVCSAEEGTGDLPYPRDDRDRRHPGVRARPGYFHLATDGASAEETARQAARLLDALRRAPAACGRRHLVVHAILGLVVLAGIVVFVVVPGHGTTKLGVGTVCIVLGLMASGAYPSTRMDRARRWADEHWHVAGPYALYVARGAQREPSGLLKVLAYSHGTTAIRRAISDRPGEQVPVMSYVRALEAQMQALRAAGRAVGRR